MSISNSSDSSLCRLEEQQTSSKINKDVLNTAALTAMDDAENGENVTGPFDSVESLMAALNA